VLWNFGRRNAQKFLMDTFALPKTNAIVQDRPGWRPEDEFTNSDGIAYRRLIPLRGRAADEQPLPLWEWDALSPGDIDRYTNLVGERADAIFKNLKTAMSTGQTFLAKLGGWVVGTYLQIGWSLGGRKKILDLFRSSITAAQRGLKP
jgi:hypothetical protein